MNAIILAGGKGTRLQSVVSDRPKPLADINGKPFLYHLLNYILKFQIIDKIILSVSYKREMIQDYFGNSFQGIPIVYSEETEPLGTGGAIKQSLELCNSNKNLVFNGDSFFELNLLEFITEKNVNSRPFSIALCEMKNFDRYGSIEIDRQIITSFHEKKFVKEGFINTGIYFIQKDIFTKYTLSKVFSLEVDFLQRYTQEIGIGYMVQTGYFIDIGIPDDYLKFTHYLNDKS